MKIESLKLQGDFVALEPLRIEHVDPLCEFGLDEELWRFTVGQNITRADMKHYVETAIEESETGKSLPFVIKHRGIDKVVGSTRFGNIDAANRKSEIGWSWIDPKWQRSVVNTETKLLMLSHAFDTWNCIRVELKTDALNEKSRKAILRLGAKEEGTLRHHMITDSGRFRDTVYFSILSGEWESVKTRLQEKMKSY